MASSEPLQLNPSTPCRRCQYQSPFPTIRLPGTVAKWWRRGAGQVAAEGGLEAEQGLPAIYHAMEALSVRLATQLARVSGGDEPIASSSSTQVSC
jgi:hypothetical protein